MQNSAIKITEYIGEMGPRIQGSTLTETAHPDRAQ